MGVVPSKKEGLFSKAQSRAKWWSEKEATCQHAFSYSFQHAWNPAHL